MPVVSNITFLFNATNVTNASAFAETSEEIFAREPDWFLAILVLIIIVTIVGNALICVVFLATKRLRTAFNYYIFNLAVVDLLVGVIAMPGFTIYNMYDGVWPYSKTFCSAWIYFDWCMTFESTITLAAMGLDRYWSIISPISYRTSHNTTTTILIILATWVYMHISYIPGYIYDRVVNVYQPHECFWDLTMNVRFAIPVAILGYYLPLIVMIYCNFAIVKVMRNRRTKTQATTVTTGATLSEVEKARNLTIQMKAARERRSLITMGVITACAVISWVPWVFYFTIAPHYPGLLPDMLVTVGYWMCYINSTVNPYLYIGTSEDFRKACRTLFCRKDERARSRVGPATTAVSTFKAPAVSIVAETPSFEF